MVVVHCAFWFPLPRASEALRYFEDSPVLPTGWNRSCNKKNSSRHLFRRKNSTPVINPHWTIVLNLFLFEKLKKKYFQNLNCLLEFNFNSNFKNIISIFLNWKKSRLSRTFVPRSFYWWFFFLRYWKLLSGEFLAVNYYRIDTFGY